MSPNWVWVPLLLLLIGGVFCGVFCLLEREASLMSCEYYT